VQRIQTLRGAVAAEEIPDFSGTFHAGSGFCFSGLYDVFVGDCLNPMRNCNIISEMLLRDAVNVGVDVASISLAEIEQQERSLEGECT
jgi:hypothetical protein